MVCPLKKQLVITCFTAIATSLALLAPYAIANSQILNHDDSKTNLAISDSYYKDGNAFDEINEVSYNKGQLSSLLYTDLSDEDFTGDAVPNSDD
jgi:hypothetical protein